MDALLAAPDQTTEQGRRDHAVLLFLYNTGARADEVAHVQIGDLMLGRSPRRDGSSVLIHGKGDKQRRCPLWARTATMLAGLVNGREPGAHAFLNRCGEPLTRFGIYTLVERYAAVAARATPAISKKACEPAHHPAHLSDSLAAGRCGHQHHPGMARPCFIDHDQYLRGSGFANEGTGIGPLRN